MALSFFEEPEDNGSGSLDFLNDWLEANPKNKEKQFPIVEIKLAKSKKGYIVSTEKFMVFLWKKSKVATMLVQAMDVWINLEPGSGFEMLVVLDSKTKDGYKLGVDKEKHVTWFQMGNGFTTLESNAHSQESDLNPFL
jgi:hypothetical protein